ncbi:coiled-coil domain-containing protein 152 isoform X2 [Grammomys surdaster]|uniref:coiled-coil domain-containing protein 152 isoform X2 n=1 Tax=Grammomys surdaster TaxID=491861 RepID=UPI0010A02F0F|nr:coiled-coil domain-containing protein 152 isoform X2 [Grammomys surdaster]
MHQNNEGNMKKMSSVNLDKLIDDFSQIEKKMIETTGKNNLLDIQLEKTNSLLKIMQTKETSMKEECITLHTMIKGLQQTVQYQHTLKVELNEENHKELMAKKEMEISELNAKLRTQEKEKQNEIFRLHLEFDTKLARAQTKSRSYPDANHILPQSIYRRKLQHLQEEKSKEIASLQSTIRDLEQRLAACKDSRLTRRRF